MATSRFTSQFTSGKWEQHYGYQSFTPEPVNLDWIADDSTLISLLSEADQKIGELKAYGALVPDIDFFVLMYAVKEATESSRIEGTKTEITEAMMQKQDIDPERRNDWEEVQNYINAMRYAIENLSTLPLSGRLLRQAHRLLLQGVRGEHKLPGEFRSSQNWIGGATLRDAVFIPPHPDRVPELMADLELFIHNEQITTPHLIRAGIVHYQFETIHPFLDGNGRLGRLLITLYLIDKGLLDRPALYLSDFFSRHRTLYYDNLTRVREKNDINQWLRFFLVGVRETSADAILTFKNILALKSQTEMLILEKFGKKKPVVDNLLSELFKHPVISAKLASQLLDVAPSTANRLIDAFVQMGILAELTGFRRNRLFEFRNYIRLFQKEN